MLIAIVFTGAVYVKLVALRKAGGLVVWKAVLLSSKLSGLEKEYTGGCTTRDIEL